MFGAISHGDSLFDLSEASAQWSTIDGTTTLGPGEPSTVILKQVNTDAETSSNKGAPHTTAKELVHDPAPVKPLDESTIRPPAIKQENIEESNLSSQVMPYTVAKEPVQDSTPWESPNDGTFRPPAMEVTQHLASQLAISDKRNTSHDTLAQTSGPPTKRDLASWWKQFKKGGTVKKEQEQGKSREISNYSKARCL